MNRIGYSVALCGIGSNLIPRTLLRTTVVGLRPQINHQIHNLGQISSKRQFSDLTSVIQSLTTSFSELHAALGIPWWALVPLVTFAFRSVITLPLAILNRKRVLKQQLLRPIIDSMYPILKFNLMRKNMLQNRPVAAVTNADGHSPSTSELVVATNDKLASLTYEQVVLLSAKEKRRRQKKLYKERKCQIWKNLSLPILQIPLWVILSLTIRNLSGWNSFLISSTPDATSLEPTLGSEGLFWFSDLAHSDPYGVLPVLLGAISLTNVELLAKFNPTSGSGKAAYSSPFFVKDTFSNRLTVFDSLLNISRLSVVFLMGISSQAPAVLVLYWISSNAFSLLQNIAFQYIWPLREDFYANKEDYLINEKNLHTKEKQPIPFVESKVKIQDRNGKRSEEELTSLLALESK